MISKYGNNLVYLQSNRDIQQEDLEFIILFFENTKLSGGNDIVKHKLMKSNLLEITYKYNESKQEVIKRYHFNYMDNTYQFVVIQPQLKNINLPNKINNMLIFANINVQNTTLLELFISYLIQDTSPSNSIERIEKSSFLRDVYYVFFKNDICFDYVLKRLTKKPQLKNKDVKIYEAFESTQLLITTSSRFNHKNFNDYEVEFDEYFSNKEDQYYVLPLKNKSQFIILNFKLNNSLKEFRSKLHSIAHLNDFVIEECYNNELFEKHAEDYLFSDVYGALNESPFNDNDQSENSSVNENISNSKLKEPKELELKQIEIEKIPDENNEELNDMKFAGETLSFS
jgi:hypothetical protein